MAPKRNEEPDRPIKGFSIFGPGDESRVPGEVLIELTPEAAQEVSVAVPGPSASFELKALGIPDLDSTLEEIRVQSISHLYFPASSTPEMPEFVVGGDDARYRIRFDREIDIGDALDLLRSKCYSVATVSPNHWREAMAAETINAQFHPAQWGLPKINCPSAWQRTRGDSDIIVAVIDSGIDLTHRDLRYRLVPGKNCVAIGPSPGPLQDGYVYSGNFASAGGQPWDEVGHGTHVAGTISCERSRAEGVAGVTQNCSLMPVRVLARALQRRTNRVQALGTAADSATGIKWAVNHGARILNLSYAHEQQDHYEREAIKHALKHGVVVIAAAGNFNTSTPMYPAGYRGVIAVSASTPTDDLARFSNRCDHVRLCAPGVQIRSTFWGKSSYASMDGTSMAAAHATGVAALLLSLNAGLTPSDIREILQTSATPLGAKLTAWALIDADAALQRAIS